MGKDNAILDTTKDIIGASKANRHFPCRLSPGPEVIKLFPCSTQLSMKFFPLIKVKMPTIVGILTCMSGKNNILGLTEPKNGQIS